MYQRNNTKNENRRSYATQQNYFTYQRKGNHELQIQALSTVNTHRIISCSAPSHECEQMFRRDILEL